MEWQGITEYPLLMAIQVAKSQADELGHVYSEGEWLCAGFDCAAKDGNQLRKSRLSWPKAYGNKKSLRYY